MTFAETLLEWFSRHGRDLPWRRRHDAYSVWLSEVILQQTRIEQGLPYWQRFIQRWPTAESLADATEDEVLREWQGLGYYSRARNLHHAARQIAAEGAFPTTYEGIRRLKGVGDYTAAAVASIAYGLPYAVVDGNVYRVLSRYYGMDVPIDTTTGRKTFARLAQTLLEEAADPSLYNQAIMDFGAIQCTPHAPLCEDCPLNGSCVALERGTQEALPVKQKRTAVTERSLTYVYVRRNGQTVLRRRGSGDIWQGLWEPLVAADSSRPDDAIALEELSRHGRLTLLRSGVRHVLTHRRLTATFYLLEADATLALPQGYRWIAEEARGQYGVPRLVELLFDAVETHTAE